MATTITGRLESLRQNSHNPRLCSGVTIHERSNRGRRLRQRRDNDGNDDEDKQLINHHHFILQIRGEREIQPRRLLALTEVLYSVSFIRDPRGERDTTVERECSL